MEHYALLDYLEKPGNGCRTSADIVETFIDTDWRCAVLRFDSKRQAKSTGTALRKYLQNHKKPIVCSIIGGMLVLERTDIGY